MELLLMGISLLDVILTIASTNVFMKKSDLERLSICVFIDFDVKCGN